MSIILSIVVIALYIIFYNRIFAVTFDEQFLKAAGLKTNLYNIVIASVIATIITLGMNLVGSLLVSALIIFPSLAAMQLFHSYRNVVVTSAVISVLCALIGIVASILLSTPVGATIVTIDGIVFVICALTGLALRKGGFS